MKTLMKDDIKLGLPEHIETVFKVEAPIEELKKYHGYKGVLLRDTDKDLVQCHLCGEWYQHLQKHVTTGHKMKEFTYRKKFGLPLHFPLCNKKYSEVARKTLLSNIKNNPPSRSKGRRKNLITKKGKANHFYSYNNASWDNKKGACPEQLNKRYLAVADIVGADPSKLDLAKYDPPLYSMIVRRGMTLNTFRAKYGYTVRPKSKKVSEHEIIGAMRKIYLNKGKVPATRDFWSGRPNYKSIIRMYGSFRKALMAANVIE